MEPTLSFCTLQLQFSLAQFVCKMFEKIFIYLPRANAFLNQRYNYGRVLVAPLCGFMVSTWSWVSEKNKNKSFILLERRRRKKNLKTFHSHEHMKKSGIIFHNFFFVQGN